MPKPREQIAHLGRDEFKRMVAEDRERWQEADREDAWLFGSIFGKDAELADEPEQPIIFRLVRLLDRAIQDVVQTEEWLPMAAGVREDFPPLQELEPSIFEGDPVNLTFDNAPNTDGLLIGFEGASIAIRASATLVITYTDGEKRTFSGDDIAMGGHWELSNTGKKVRSVELIFKSDETE